MPPRKKMNLEQVAAASIKMPIFKVKTMQSKVSSKSSFFLFLLFWILTTTEKKRRRRKLDPLREERNIFFLAIYCSLRNVWQGALTLGNTWKHLQDKWRKHQLHFSKRQFVSESKSIFIRQQRKNKNFLCHR